MNLKIKITTRQLAMVVIFAAIYAILRRIQTIPMIGISGASFSLSDAVAPLVGIILGPFLGGLSVITGTFLAFALGKPVVFLGLDFLPALVNAVALGFLARHKWTPVVALYIALLSVFLLLPYTSLLINVGGISIPFVWLHIVGLVVLLSPLGMKAGKWIETIEPAKLAAGLATLAFVGTMAQHLMGNILYEIVFGQPIGPWDFAKFTTNWNVIFFLYPWERMILVVLAVVIGIPLVRTLKKSHLLFEKPKNTKPLQQSPS